MALNFLSSASINVHGSSIGASSMKGFCTFNGFMIQTFVVQSIDTLTFALSNGANKALADYWVLVIASSTYLILANHKHMSNWIQTHRIVVWILPWALSILWASIGLGVVDYGDIGACKSLSLLATAGTDVNVGCWFTSDRVRLYVNFIPRVSLYISSSPHNTDYFQWLIIITILILYIRLFYIIHQAHTRFETFDSDVVNSDPSNPRLSLHISQTTDPSDCEVQRPAPSNFQVSRDTKRLRRISLQMMVYPLVYMLIWTIPTTIRIYQATTGKSAPFGIGTVDKVSYKSWWYDEQS
jgi:hypothetical protein